MATRSGFHAGLRSSTTFRRTRIPVGAFLERRYSGRPEQQSFAQNCCICRPIRSNSRSPETGLTRTDGDGKHGACTTNAGRSTRSGGFWSRCQTCALLSRAAAEAGALPSEARLCSAAPPHCRTFAVRSVRSRGRAGGLVTPGRRSMPAFRSTTPPSRYGQYRHQLRHRQ